MLSFLGLMLLMLVTVYVALMYHNAFLLLLCFLEAVLFVLSFFLLLYQKRMLCGRLELPVGISEQGKNTLVKLVVTNRSIFAVKRMKATVTVTDGYRKTKKKNQLTLPVAHRGETEFILGISFEGTGTYEVTLKKLRIYDAMGLLYGTLHLKSVGRVQVMPKLCDVPVRLTPATKNFYGEADVYDDCLPGYDNSEIFEVREYQKGDRLQNVHWKLTAKQDDLMVKEHSLPKACPVIFLLEYRTKKRKKRQPDVIAYMEAAASISFSIMDAGCPHYVVWYDGAEGDIKRLRVDSEESLFYFIGVLMQLRFETPKESLLWRYREKYRREPYVWTVSLEENLVLKKGEETLTQLTGTTLEQELMKFELVL